VLHGVLNSMPWFLGAAFFLLAPSSKLATSFPFLLDTIDLVDLVWVLCRKCWFSDGVEVKVRFLGLMMEIGEEFVLFGLGFNGLRICCLDG